MLNKIINHYCSKVKSAEELPVLFRCLIPHHLCPPMPLRRVKAPYTFRDCEVYILYYKTYWTTEFIPLNKKE